MKQAVTVLCGGASPETEAGQIALAQVSVRAATGLLVGLLASKEVRDHLLMMAGFLEILTPWDKRKIQRAYDEFLEIVKDADFSSQENLDRALLLADEKLGNVTVWRRYFSRVLRRDLPVRRSLMKFAAPVCFVSWAQQPFLAHTGCIRYVATAMNTKQARPAG